MDIINGQSLREAWDDLAQLHGDKTALIFEDVAGHTRQYSYAGLNDEINRAANLFTTQGIRKGDRVALHLNNSVEFILCWFGLAKIGAVMVPINTHLLQEECAYIVHQCQVKAVVTRPEFLPIYLEIQQSQPALTELLITGGCGSLKGTANFDRLPTLFTHQDV